MADLTVEITLDEATVEWLCRRRFLTPVRGIQARAEAVLREGRQREAWENSELGCLPIEAPYPGTPPRCACGASMALVSGRNSKPGLALWRCSTSRDILKKVPMEQGTGTKEAGQ